MESLVGLGGKNGLDLGGWSFHPKRKKQIKGRVTMGGDVVEWISLDGGDKAVSLKGDKIPIFCKEGEGTDVKNKDKK